MKNLIKMFFVIVCFCMVSQAQAQLNWGLKIGANLSDASFKGLKDVKVDNLSGFFVGPMIEFKFPVFGLGVDGSLLYSQTKMKFINETTNIGVTNKQHELDIPVNLKWSFGLGSMLGAYIAAGPQFGFNIGNKKGFMNYDLKKNNTSFNVGAGVKLIRHLQLGVNYNFALGHTATLYADPNIILDGKPLTQDVKIKNNTWQVSLAYLF